MSFELFISEEAREQLRNLPDETPMDNLTQEAKEPTLQEVCAELARLKDRVEELEDARELEAAILRTATNS